MEVSRTGCARLITLLITVICGCRGNVDLLEARLREQEDALYAQRRQLENVQTELQVARSDADELQRQLALATSGQVLPEDVQGLVRIKTLEVDHRLTGVLPGAPTSYLNVVVVPRDLKGQSVYVPGTLVIRVIGQDQDGEHLVLERSFAGQDLHNAWSSSLIGEGFQLSLACDAGGRDRMTVECAFETVDGRTFKDSHEVTIDLLPKPPLSEIPTEESVVEFQ